MRTNKMNETETGNIQLIVVFEYYHLVFVIFYLLLIVSVMFIAENVVKIHYVGNCALIYYHQFIVYVHDIVRH